MLAGTYTFSPFRIVVLKKDDPLRDKFFSFVELPGLPDHIFSIYVEPEDELVLMAVGEFLHLSFNKNKVFHSNSFAYRGVQRTSVVKNLAGET